LFLSHHQVALSYGYKMFAADTVDDLTLEQYNVLITLWNAKQEKQVTHANKHTTSISNVPGRVGIDYGDD